MADVMANPKVEQQRLRMQIAAQRHQVEQQTLAILEMADRKARHLENIAAAHRAIAEFERTLASLDAAHGALTPEIAEAMTASLDEEV